MRARLLRKAFLEELGSLRHKSRAEQSPPHPNMCPAKAVRYFLAEFGGTLWPLVERFSSQPDLHLASFSGRYPHCPVVCLWHTASLSISSPHLPFLSQEQL